MHASSLLPFVIMATIGCFREAPAGGAAPTPLALTVSDPQGATYAAGHAPWLPWLALDFGGRPPADALQRVRLVPGIVAPALAARFASTRKNALDTRALPLASEPMAGGSELRVRPEEPLTSGTPYTLLWLAEQESKSFVLTASPEPAMGARLSGSWPSEGASGVPAQLVRALMHFEGTLVGDVAGHVSLRHGDQPLPCVVWVERCSLRSLPGGDCVWLEPRTPLAPGEHQLVLSPGLHAPTGAPVAAASVRFDVHDGGAAQLTAVPTRCAPDEAAQQDVCTRFDGRALHVRGSTSDAALVTLLAAQPDGVRSAATLSYANAFALALALPTLSSPGSVLLRLTSLSGTSIERELHVQPEAELARVTIDEVRPDPLGKEPAQEYVELRNFGTTPVSLMGFSLTTDLHQAGRKIVHAVPLSPGERALVVAPDFDEQDVADGVLPGGTRLMRLDGALSLANSSLTLLLRDARGRRLSSARVQAPLVEGQCSARYPLDTPARDEAVAMALDPAGGCSVGAPTLFSLQEPDG